jgi:hypothetical protein
MEWMSDPRLWVAATPACVFIGAAVAFYFATESGDGDPSPVVKRAETEWEPWGIPVRIKRYRIPGDSVIRTRRVLEDETTQFARIEDERTKINA